MAASSSPPAPSGPAAPASPRVAVIGASGQLGSDLVRAMEDWTPVGLGHAEIEVTDGPGVLDRLAAIAPDVVINCAAFHRVDECEANPEEAFRVNALGARNVAQACARLGALAVYISTDYVFDGGLGRPYFESDVPAPLNVYGASKLAGEHLTAAFSPRHLIVRVSSLFGVAGASGKGGNFVETMIRKARAGEAIRVVDDIVMSPTYTADAAVLVRALIAGGCQGVFHAANAGACSWYAFARAIFDLLGCEADPQPQRAADLSQAAPRPTYSALASSRLPGLGLAQAPWRDALRRYLTTKGHPTEEGAIAAPAGRQVAADADGPRRPVGGE